MRDYSYFQEDESLQLALALSLSAARDSQQGAHHGSFDRPALELADTSKDEELARQLQEELLLQERAEDGGANYIGGASAGSDAPASAPPHPQQQPLPQQQPQQPVLGRRPNSSPIERLLGGVASKLPSKRWAGSGVSPEFAVPASGSVGPSSPASQQQPSKPRPPVSPTSASGSGNLPQWAPSPLRPKTQSPTAAAQPPRSLNHCTECGERIWPHNDSASASGRRFHGWCLKCAECGQLLPRTAGSSFNIGEDGKLYHPQCHRQKFHPRCSCCNDHLPIDAMGMVRFHHQPFWNTKFCARHEADGTPRCHACNRLQIYGQDWIQFGEGQHTCLECLSTIVRNTADAQPLYDDVLSLYAHLNMPLPTRPPLMLVESAALNEATGKVGLHGQGGSGPKTDGPVFHTRGLCLSEEHRSIRTVVGSREGGGWLKALPRMVDVPGSSRWEVTAILILHGLPWLLTGSILAHEVMHAWLRLSGYGRLSCEVEEGLAQLMALLWLERQQPPAGSFDERLQSHLGEQIRSDPSHVYGEGFRAAYEAFRRVNGDLPRVLDAVKRTGALPL
mmetsp:Transcript_20267/g.61060  ORF Transcript_20267/g.61060 Transcript_20267/m.61060 type:complete len:562 (-) Transcript_20267:314-1999(-)